MTGNPPLVSVIIPTYHSRGTLKLSLESVLLQDFADYEVWVVGDGCTDDSEAVVSSFHDTRLHWTNLATNSGTPSAPRNEGLRRANGTYIAYLGHDDLWFPWHLSALVDCMKENHCDFAYSLGLLVGPGGVVGAFSLPEKAWIRQHVSPSNWIHTKELTDSMGGWSTDKRRGDDRVFLRRMSDLHSRTGFCRQLTVLKYPAALWRMYALRSDFPQEAQLLAMTDGAEALRISLLTECAASMALNKIDTVPGKNRFHTAIHNLMRTIFDAYGRDRWPLNDLLYRWWRRKSGLDQKPPNLNG